ncbi:MAG: serine hydrolase [Chlamydiota bacterium]|nr:serine hydrolase [Chlamydiota bacterium]
MRSWRWGTFWLLTGFPLSLTAALSGQGITSPHCLLMNAKTGAILFEKGAYEGAYPASLTKIATLLYLFDRPQLSEDVMIRCDPKALIMKGKKANPPPYFLESDGAHFWISPGEWLSTRDLLMGMAIRSANDAANCLAHHYGGGSIPHFMEGLNAYLNDRGYSRTQFQNPHGLHDPRHRTTAYELAMMMRDLLSIPRAVELLGLSEGIRKKGEEEFPFSHHLALKKEGGEFHLPGLIIGKTGYTKKAGHCLAAAAERGDRQLIAISLGAATSSDRYRDLLTLFERAFHEEVVHRVLFNKEGASFHHPQGIAASLREEVSIDYYPSESSSLAVDFTWFPLDHALASGEPLGELNVIDRWGVVRASSLLFADQGWSPHWLPSWWSRGLMFGGGVFSLCFLSYCVYRRRS